MSSRGLDEGDGRFETIHVTCGGKANFSVAHIAWRCSGTCGRQERRQ